MAEYVYHVRSTRAKVRRLAALLPAVLSGRAADPTGQARGSQLRVGMVALSFIKLAFLAKARGGTDEAGDSWPPLSEKYVAYGRPHPGLNAVRQKAAKQGHGSRPLLTQQQDQRWRSLYGRRLHRATRGQAASREDKAAAAAYAWAVVKSEGGRTILGEYGKTKVEILRSSGLLLNSLSPGVDGGPSGHPNQVARVSPGEVIIGTNRPGAGAHHRGTAKLPQRRLWPDPARWPASWNLGMVRTLRDGAVLLFARMLGA